MNIPIPQALAIAAAHRKAGRLADADAICRQILAVAPADAATLHLAGVIAQQRGDAAASFSFISRAIHSAPSGLMYQNLGIALQGLRRLDESVTAFRQAATLGSDGPKLRLLLGISLRGLGRLEEAADCFRASLDSLPDSVDAHANLGQVLQAQGKLGPAIAHYRRAVELAPTYAEACNNLGLALKDQGHPGEALAAFRRALALKPGLLGAHSNLLLAMNALVDVDPAAYLAEAIRFGQAAGAAAVPFTDWLVEPRGSDVSRLRIGLVSGDLRNHAVSFFLESILAALDPARVELVAYPTTTQADELTARIRPRFSAWQPIAGLDDRTAAQRIRDDRIHVLVDLAGHTAHNRLSLFAWRPAPLQVAWLGYFASTGLRAIDYVLADPDAVPPGNEGQFVEKIWRLPETRLCFTPPAHDVVPAPEPPMQANGYVTFGCFQHMSKVNDHVLALWSRVMAAVPHARLRVQNNEMRFPDGREAFARRLQAAGIAPARVTLAGLLPRGEYLASYAQVDVLLDTYPYTGGATTCEALWMGLPTVTRAGDTMIARQGAGLLRNAGLPGWVAGSDDEYVAIAVRHADDVAGLRHLRAGLRAQVQASPLCDAPRFCRHLEAAWHGMWRTVDNEGGVA